MTSTELKDLYEKVTADFPECPVTSIKIFYNTVTGDLTHVIVQVIDKYNDLYSYQYTPTSNGWV